MGSMWRGGRASKASLPALAHGRCRGRPRRRQRRPARQGIARRSDEAAGDARVLEQAKDGVRVGRGELVGNGHTARRDAVQREHILLPKHFRHEVRDARVHQRPGKRGRHLATAHVEFPRLAERALGLEALLALRRKRRDHAVARRPRGRLRRGRPFHNVSTRVDWHARKGCKRRLGVCPLAVGGEEVGVVVSLGGIALGLGELAVCAGRAVQRRVVRALAARPPHHLHRHKVVPRIGGVLC